LPDGYWKLPISWSCPKLWSGRGP